MHFSLGNLRSQVRRYVPITAWLPAYDRQQLSADAIAGVTVWGVMTPVALAYAQMAGVPAVAGLYTAFAALMAYAIFGTSRHLKVTASSTMAVMSAAVVGALAGGDAARYAALTAGLAVTVGLILLAAGIARLGFISDFLSKSVVTGFVFGLALTIAIGQAPKLFGVPSTSGNFFQQVYGLVVQIPEANPRTMVIGFGTIAILLLIRHYYPRIPGGLVVLAMGILAVTFLHLDEKGVSTIGVFPTGLPTPRLPDVRLIDVPYLLTGAAGIVFLAVGESLGSARAFAARHRYEIDADQEMIALGAANLGTGLFQGFTADASLSSSATGENAGARTQVSSLVTAALIFITLLFLAPLFKNLPNAVLGGIVIVAVIGLMDVAELKRYYASNRNDFLLAMVALFGVITTDVLMGLIIAVMLSLLIILYRSSRPHVAVLGKIPGQVVGYGDIGRHPENVTESELLIVRLDAPLYFLNANVARTQVLDMVAASQPPPRAVIFHLGASADLDVASLDMLRTLLVELEELGIQVFLAQVRGGVRDRLRLTGVMDVLGAGHVYPSVDAAVYAFRQQAGTVAGEAAAAGS